ncbi:hypothetical protein PFISCL1PPCAC_15280, partial [Pristionchus fissidentatus]
HLCCSQCENSIRFGRSVCRWEGRPCEGKKHEREDSVELRRPVELEVLLRIHSKAFKVCSSCDKLHTRSYFPRDDRCLLCWLKIPQQRRVRTGFL